MGGGIFTDSCILAIIMFVYAKLLAWFKKKKKKSLKSAANLNNSPNEEFCSSVKKIFLQNTNILMHVYHLILIKYFPILQTLQYTATQKILSVNTKPFI